MPRVIPLLVLFAILSSMLIPLSSSADGLVIVDPPPCDPACMLPMPVSGKVAVENHHVDVQIVDQVATTTIGQSFRNVGDTVAEGTYLFPVPTGAAVTDFAIIVDGEPVEATLLDANQARDIYEQIVSKMRDPGLLEYVGRSAIQARIFPIQPGDSREVQISYQQVLTAEQGVVEYTYPLNTERFSAQPLQSVSVSVSVESNDPIRAVYSPTHEIAVDRPDVHHFVAGWEASNVLPESDFSLLYSLSQDRVGLDLISEWSDIDQEGTFVLLAAPGIETDGAVTAKDVIVVLDTSGSMEGEKIEQARYAVSYLLDHLNPEDRFAVLEFSTGVRTYTGELQSASEAAAAKVWVQGLEASGGTNIDEALGEAMTYVDSARPTYLFFVTDGLATEGEIETSAILSDVDAAAPDSTRLFAFGVGDDVDTVLLDSLASEHHGASAYVRPGERLDETLPNFYAKVSSPVMTDISLDAEGATIEDFYPTPLPDLFAGSQVVITGRYHEADAANFRLTGQVDGKTVSFETGSQQLASSSDQDTLGLARIWATRKVGYLLSQIRLHGENRELIDAIVDLSVRYGIVTPYTSYLITEDDILTADGREEAAAKAMATSDPNAPVSGAAAVDQAAAQGAMESADLAVPVQTGETGEAMVKAVGDRTFVLQSGVWTDTTFDPSRMETKQVEFASAAYFQLLDDHPELAPVLALGDHIIVTIGGVALEVVPTV